MNNQVYNWGNPQKPILVFLHGLGSSALSFKELTQYLKDFYIIAVNIPGHGGRKELDSSTDYKYQTIVELIYQDIKPFIKNRKVSIAGHSWGAELALK